MWCHRGCDQDAKTRALGGMVGDGMWQRPCLCNLLSKGTLVFRSFTKKQSEKNSTKTELVLHRDETDNKFYAMLGTCKTFGNCYGFECVKWCYEYVLQEEQYHLQ